MFDRSRAVLEESGPRLTNPSNPHKQDIVSLFDRAATLYDRVGIRQFTHFGRALIAHLAPPPGAAVLDLACGRGALLLAAAEQVGPTGRVIGVDLAPGMVSAARDELAAKGITWAQVVLGDADDAAFAPHSFDCIVCGFALHFLDYQRVLARCRTLLKPGGCFAAAQPYIPINPTERERWRWLPELARAAFPPDFVPPSSWIAPNQLNTVDRLEPVLRAAGFDDLRFIHEEALLHFADEADWWDWEWSQGSRFWVEAMSPEALARFQRESFAHLAAMKSPQGIAMLLGALLVVARVSSGA